MIAKRSGAALAAAMLAALSLAGCREEEQRVRDYEPGVYKGAPDQSIDEETRRKLRERSRLQSFN